MTYFIKLAKKITQVSGAQTWALQVKKSRHGNGSMVAGEDTGHGKYFVSF